MLFYLGSSIRDKWWQNHFWHSVVKRRSITLIWSLYIGHIYIHSDDQYLEKLHSPRSATCVVQNLLRKYTQLQSNMSLCVQLYFKPNPLISDLLFWSADLMCVRQSMKWTQMMETLRKQMSTGTRCSVPLCVIRHKQSIDVPPSEPYYTN